MLYPKCTPGWGTCPSSDEPCCGFVGAGAEVAAGNVLGSSWLHIVLRPVWCGPAASIDVRDDVESSSAYFKFLAF